MGMNKYDIIVTDTLGLEHRYYIETTKDKKEIMNDVNEGWNKNTGIQINYIEDGKECICIYDNKKVISVDVKKAVELDELIEKIKKQPNIWIDREGNIKEDKLL